MLRGHHRRRHGADACVLEGGLFDGIDDEGAGGAGDCCTGITAGVMALTLVSWQMRLSVRVGTVEVLNSWLLW